MRKTKYLAVILAAIAVLESCSTTTAENTKTDPSNVKVESTKESQKNDKEKATEKTEKQATEAPKEDKDVVLWKNKYCTIHYKGTEKSFMGLEIKLYIENTGKKNITVQADSMTINDFTLDPVFSSEINSGKKANDEITILSTDLEKNKLSQENIKNIEVKFNVFDPETFDTLVKSDTIKITMK